MPYPTIPTLSDGQILTASHMNTMSAAIAFLQGIAYRGHTTFNSFRAVHVTLDKDVMEWTELHEVPFLHWKITSQGGPWNYARLYYAGVKVGKAAPGTVWQGVFNLASWAGLPNSKGAWASGVAYESDVDGDGDNGNGDDGAIVSEGAGYYRCKVAHTSAAANRPNSGASWTTYWDGLVLPAVNSFYKVYADVNFSAGTEVTVEFIFEKDAAVF